MINYIVTIRDFKSHRKVKCSTEEEVWKAIGSSMFGGLYEVSSPTKKSVNEFVPF